MASLLALLILGGLMHAARSFAPSAGLDGTPAGTAMGLGYLLLSGHLAGNIFKAIHLPRLTGYLVTGLVVGPGVLDLVSQEMVINLRIFNGIAIALIALTAGSEMEYRIIRPQLRTIAWITVIAVAGTTILLSAAAYLLRSQLPFMDGMPAIVAAAAAAVLGVTMSAQSPAVAVALRDEMRADGPLTRTVLGVVVFSDVFIILMFAAVSLVAHAVMGQNTEASAAAMDLAREIFGSAIAGVLIGLVTAALLKRVTRGSALFVLAVGFAVAEIGQRVQLDPLLIALSMGCFIRNATSVGDRLLQEIESGSLPVYVAFFAVAGATIHADLLLVVGLPALVFSLVRAFGFLVGTRTATRLADAPPVVRSYAGLGLLPQSGLALALALLFTRTFPEFGDSAATLVFAVVAINELIGPVLYRIAIVKSGEAGEQDVAFAYRSRTGSAASVSSAD